MNLYPFCLYMASPFWNNLICNKIDRMVSFNFDYNSSLLHWLTITKIFPFVDNIVSMFFIYIVWKIISRIFLVYQQFCSIKYQLYKNFRFCFSTLKYSCINFCEQKTSSIELLIQKNLKFIAIFLSKTIH